VELSEIYLDLRGMEKVVNRGLYIIGSFEIYAHHIYVYGEITKIKMGLYVGEKIFVQNSSGKNLFRYKHLKIGDSGLF
jgi:hypothetical protein